VDLHVDPVWLTGFLLASTRAAAFIVLCPPFNSSAVNSRVKVAIAVALGLAMAPSFPVGTDVLSDVGAFVLAVAGQVATGLALGFVVLVLFSAVQSAGALVDLGVGFSSATLFDPFSNSAATPFGRFYQVLGVTILVCINGHLLVVRGLMASFHVSPLGAPDPATAARVVIEDVSTFFFAAIQIALPLAAAMLLAEIGLGLLAKAAPQMNVLVVGFAVKTGLILLLAGAAIRVLPGSVETLLGDGLRSMARLVGG
jgi:flagellar biosynthetic protein FliR